KALFTASFLPGFMLASFFIIYIIVRTQLHPEDAPLPELDPNDPPTREKMLLFGAFATLMAMGFAALLLVRGLFQTVTGGNAILEGVDPVPLGMVSDLPYMIGGLVVGAVLLQFVFGRERTATG